MTARPTAEDEHGADEFELIMADLFGPTLIGPYAAAAHRYREIGSPLPLPIGAKTPPPEGFTGSRGRAPSAAEIERWANNPTPHNIALRLNGDVIALDVDHYGAKAGADDLAAFEEQHGALPPTWRSSSRGADNPSGHYLYRVPNGTRLRSGFGNVDVLQRHHRYLVVAPSVHPNGGNYEWFDDAGEQSDRPPYWDDLPELPSAWVKALLSVGDGNTAVASTPEQVRQFTEHHTASLRPQGLDGLRSMLADRSGQSRHDTLVEVACMATREVAAGWYSLTEAESVLSQWWASKHDDPRRLDGPEFDSVMAWAVSQVDTPAGQRQIAEKVEQLDSTAAPIPAQVSGLVDWSSAWNTDHAEHDWLCEPLLARGRAHALFAGAKTGKSLLALEIVAALTTGRPTLLQEAGPPLTVLYLDMEMTEGDVIERLADMGYGPGDDLSRLRYYLLADLPPLDTEKGGTALAQLAEHHGADLVVVDTMSRVLEGEENSADTIRKFALYSAMPLKRAGRTMLRLDHSGKDSTKGQRGTSAKVDDVDVVWKLDATEKGLKLTATHRRISWVPERIDLTREDSPLRHALTVKGWPPGTNEAVDLLDRLNVPLSAGRRVARQMITDAGEQIGNEALQAGLRCRKQAEVGEIVLPGRDRK